MSSTCCSPSVRSKPCKPTSNRSRRRLPPAPTPSPFLSANIRKTFPAVCNGQARNRSWPLQTAGNVFRIFADKNGDGVGAGGNLRLERFDVGLQGFDLALGEQHVEFVGQAAIETGLCEVEDFSRRLDVAVEDLQPVL